MISAGQIDWSSSLKKMASDSGETIFNGTSDEMSVNGMNESVESMPSTEYHLIWDELKHSIDLNLSFRIVFYLIYGIIFAFGIIGNLLVCWVVFRQVAMRTVTNIFIANLALSDILLCLFCVPFTPLYLLAIKEWQFGTFSNLLCHLVPFAQGKSVLTRNVCLVSCNPTNASIGVSVYLSVFTMCAISIERYSVIVHPFRSPITVSSCIIIIFFIWVFAIILTLPYGIFMQVLNVVHILPSVKEFINQNETDSKFELYNSTANATLGVQMPKIDRKDREYLKNLLSQPKEIAVNSAYRSLFSPPKLYCDEMWPGDNLRVIYGITTTGNITFQQILTNEVTRFARRTRVGGHHYLGQKGL